MHGQPGAQDARIGPLLARMVGWLSRLRLHDCVCTAQSPSVQTTPARHAGQASTARTATPRCSCSYTDIVMQAYAIWNCDGPDGDADVPGVPGQLRLRRRITAPQRGRGRNPTRTVLVTGRDDIFALNSLCEKWARVLACRLVLWRETCMRRGSRQHSSLKCLMAAAAAIEVLASCTGVLWRWTTVLLVNLLLEFMQCPVYAHTVCDIP